ncbi:leucine-rich repeat domain-containing protein [Pontimicrobium sp. MEBiC06410]
MATPPPPGFKNELEYLQNTLEAEIPKSQYQLNNLGQIVYLKLSDIGLYTIDALSHLKSLKELLVVGNLISDITPLKNLSNLEVLDLSYNKITNLESISGLKKLTYFHARDNQIQDIEPLENLKFLNNLSLSRNKIRNLNPLENLIKLNHLFLGNNQIQDIKPLKNLNQLSVLELDSNYIMSIEPLKNLIKLRQLTLGDNKIYNIEALNNLHELNILSIPFNQISNIFPLESLRSLTQLSLNNNQISSIRAIRELNKLTRLILNSNEIEHIEPLNNLTKLIQLSLSKNKITKIEPLENLNKLGQLDLSNNEISNLTPLKKLLHLKSLIIRENPIENIPTNILNSSAQEIIRWLNENTNQPEYKKQLLKDIKVLLLGNTNIGKSNLLFLWQQHYKAIDGRTKYPENSDSTHGLVYESFSKTKESTQLHLWDFGGQDYFHATHQLFFSPDALHIILWAKQHPTRKANEQVFQLDYWLRCAEQLSTSNNAIETVLVENYIDLENTDSTEYYTHFPESAHLKKFAVYSPHNTEASKQSKSNFVINTCSVSLLKKQRINGLFEILEERIDHIQSKNKYPSIYIEIRDKLANSNKTVWTLKDYKTEFKETDNTILKTLHRAGCILYFHEQLPNIIFNKPEALLNLIYKDILNEKLQKAHGKITEEIKNAGKSNNLGLTATNIETLLDSFNLIFKTKGKKDKQYTWYVPQYLPEAEPSWLELLKKYTFSYANVVITSDHYLMNVILLEIFQEYGVEIKRNEDQSYMFWQNGLIIEKDEQLLLVIYDRQNMTLQLYGDQQGNNLKLQKEVVDFVLKTTTPEEKNVMDYRHSEIKLDATSKGETFDIPDKHKDRDSWKSDIIDIMVSKDGKYYININELYNNVESKMYTVKGYDYTDNSNFKTFSVFSFNQYLADKDQGQMKKVAISYSKDDLTLVNEFIKNLVPLHDDGLIENPWYCSQLEAGSEWNKEIQDKFKQANIIFFMVSPNFLATKYIKEHEIKTAIARREKEIVDNILPRQQLKIIPIILDFCRWDRKDDRYNLGKYTALPYTAKPVADFKNKNKAWYIIEECIRTAIEKDNDPEFDTNLSKAVKKIYEDIINSKV